MITIARHSISVLQNAAGRTELFAIQVSPGQVPADGCTSTHYRPLRERRSLTADTELQLVQQECKTAASLPRQAQVQSHRHD